MEPEAAPREQRSREMFFALVGPHVKRVYHFVRHVLGYHQAIGNLRPGELSPEEAVDAALVPAMSAPHRSPDPAVGAILAADREVRGQGGRTLEKSQPSHHC
jgi:hypothetical protein